MVSNKGATGILDGDNGIGYIVGNKAMQIAIDKANQFGVGIVGVKNSTFFGTVDYLAEMSVRNKMIGIVSTNGSPTIAPWGDESLPWH